MEPEKIMSVGVALLCMYAEIVASKFIQPVGRDVHAQGSSERTSVGRTNWAKVLILGAGAAGMSAAKELTQNGITDFLMIEGSNRIGGRLKSVRFGGKTVEAGANWMMVRNARNPLWQTIQKYNISGRTLDEKDVLIRYMNGEDVTTTAGAKAWEKLSIAKETMSEITTRMTSGAQSDMSIRACLGLGEWEPVTAVENVAEVFEYDFQYGNTPEVSSCRSDGILQQYLDGMYYIADEKGFESVIKNVADEIFEQNDERLILNEVVHTINYTDSNVVVETSSSTIYISEFVLLTFSIGVLKSGSVIFNPSLPEWKVDNLARVRFENYMSIFLKFPDNTRQFWDDALYILHAHERRNFYPVWINHNSDAMSTEDTNILQLVTFGEEADRISKMDDAEITKEVMEVLRKVYCKGNVSEPEDVLITRWKTDPLYQGSFANVQPGIPLESLGTISAPVGRLHFAGDAYSEFDGYVVGAAISGVESARRILQTLRDGANS
ncbi:polyamine oxidase 1-like isoform X2 [Haliotis rubra]|uniref:polyamine oxidase 1-like isoform X2 n=1 Tax=Haliotis rubra TaxID=36100 RepID=UPI001EE52F5D|nr:polyamine oxidase 1-like isoform X2 [Haliotis rubra]